MDLQLYEGIKHYIKYRDFPTNVTNQLKNQINNKYRDYLLHEDKLYFNKKNQRRLVIKENELENILHEGHSSISGGHFATEATYNKLSQNFYWPNMYKRIQAHVQSCGACQRRGKPKKHEPLHSIKVKEPFELIGIDCVGPLPITSKGNRHIIVLTDYFTKWPEAKAVPDIKASTIAEFVWEVISRHGTPQRILTDQGSSFDNEMFNHLCDLMGTKHILATAYHPQTNGLTERFNQTLCNTIAKYIDEGGKEWDQWINAALYSYRQKNQSSTKFTPSMMLYGREIKTPLTLEKHGLKSDESEIIETADQYVELIANRKQRIQQIARTNQNKAHDKQKKAYDQKIKAFRFKIGEKVLLYRSERQNVHGNKMESPYLGPFYIHSVEDNGTYSLRECDSGRIRERKVTGDRLTRWNDRKHDTPKVYMDNNQQRIQELEKRVQQKQIKQAPRVSQSQSELLEEQTRQWIRNEEAQVRREKQQKRLQEIEDKRKQELERIKFQERTRRERAERRQKLETLTEKARSRPKTVES